MFVGLIHLLSTLFLYSFSTLNGVETTVHICIRLRIKEINPRNGLFIFSTFLLKKFVDSLVCSHSLIHPVCVLFHFLPISCCKIYRVAQKIRFTIVPWLSVELCRFCCTVFQLNEMVRFNVFQTQILFSNLSFICSCSFSADFVLWNLLGRWEGKICCSLNVNTIDRNSFWKFSVC